MKVSGIFYIVLVILVSINNLYGDTGININISSKPFYLNKIGVKSFTQASIKGWQYAFDNIDETDDLLLERIYDIYNTMGFINHKADLNSILAYPNINEKKYIDLFDYSLLFKIIAVVIVILLIIGYRQRALIKYNQKLYDDVEKATRNLKKRNQTLVKKQTELRESINNFKNLFDTTMEMIVIYKKNGEIIEINQPGVTLFGFENKSELIGKNFLDFILKSEIGKIKESMTKDILEPNELIMVDKYNKKVYTLISGRNTIRAGEQVRICSVVNLTDIKKKDKYIQHQSKLALMGEMISMIAHQWRQPLNILGAINIKIETKLDFDEEFTSQSYAPISDDINKQLAFMSKTIDDFRDFFKPNREKEETDFTKLVNSSLGIIESSIKSKHINIVKELHCENKFITYANEITQVILNIIKNAEDIFLEKDIKDPYIKLISYRKDDKNILEIIDNGGGIPEDIIEKIFDPYFSTKLEKNGTGLGLYMSKTIIEEHCNGELTVENNNDEVIFRISL